MGTVSKILGSSKPVATTATTLYTCPISTEANITVFICNQSATASAVRLAVVPDVDTLADTDYILYDYSLSGNNSIAMDDIKISAGDILVCYTANATVSFVAIGTQTS